jgi:hypothetical protein
MALVRIHVHNLDVCKMSVSCCIHATNASEDFRKQPQAIQCIFNRNFGLVLVANSHFNNIRESKSEYSGSDNRKSATGKGTRERKEMEEKRGKGKLQAANEQKRNQPSSRSGHKDLIPRMGSDIR